MALYLESLGICFIYFLISARKRDASTFYLPLQNTYGLGP